MPAGILPAGSPSVAFASLANFLLDCDGCIKDAAQILEQVMDIKTTEE